MARIRESLIIEELSFLDEKLGGNSLLTLRNLMYFLFGGLIAYKLIEGGGVKLVIGVIILLFVLALIVYPKRSLTLENILIGAISYYLEPQGEAAKKKEAKKQEKQKTTKNLAKKPLAIPKIDISLTASGIILLILSFILYNRISLLAVFPGVIGSSLIASEIVYFLMVRLVRLKKKDEKKQNA
ncbi:hypothetical protein AAGT10_14755 (plasmid) [Sulfolobus tengchongensis]|uniref:Uncharacterized protein n=1 Tax=Sulfolobus tengchongensis TaxID=207809 RepID=A0AAX4KZX4_9CREN